MITGYTFYKAYTPVKLHFQQTTKYNAITYCSKSNTITGESFERRKDRGIFDYWAGHFNSKRDAFEFCLYNFANNSFDWFYDKYDSAKDIWLNTKSFYSAWNKNYQDELKFIESIVSEKSMTFDRMLRSTSSGARPPLLQLLLTKKISREFVCINDIDHKYLEDWLKEYQFDPFINSELKKLISYQEFVRLLTVEGK